MSESLLGTLLIALMFVLFAMGVEIAIALGVVGVVGLLVLKGWTVGLGVVGSIAWTNATSFSFIAVPLFVFMSGILLHSGIGRGLYTAVARWVSFLPGGLAVASIFSCAIFAAISGSSVATAATIGMIAIPEMQRRGYSRPLICGSLAAGGTLGILIPPSIPMIIYGVMTETSIGHLYMAGIVPGLVLALMFAGFVIGYATLWPDTAPRALFDLVVGLGLPRWAFFTLVFSFLLLIAYALEELSVMIILLPVLFPLITGLGFDPVWFGIIMVVWLEIGLITPPVGLNLFVIQTLMRGTTARDVTVGTTPYVLLMVGLVILLFLFPDLALWLPRQMVPSR